MVKKELSYAQQNVETLADAVTEKLEVDTDKNPLVTRPTRPSWPPPPRTIKRRPITKTASLILATILATALVLSAVGLLLFKTTKNYGSSIRRVATAQVQQTISVQSTGQAQVRGTAQYIDTAQAQIEATATAQVVQTAQATQSVNDATATAQASVSQYQTLTANTPSIDDPLTDNSSTNHWDTGGADANTGCAFTDSTYHALEEQQTYLQPCIAQATNVTDFAYQANVTILKGDQGQAGLLFRAGSGATSYYFFHIGIDGSYALDLYNGTNQATTLLQGSNNSIINVGVNQMNQMMVMADKTTITILVNSTYLGAVTNSTLTEGQIGVGVIDNNTPIDATFADAQIWKLQ
jgi:hypothetical protein